MWVSFVANSAYTLHPLTTSSLLLEIHITNDVGKSWEKKFINILSLWMDQLVFRHFYLFMRKFHFSEMNKMQRTFYHPKLSIPNGEANLANSCKWASIWLTNNRRSNRRLYIAKKPDNAWSNGRSNLKLYTNRLLFKNNNNNPLSEPNIPISWNLHVWHLSNHLHYSWMQIIINIFLTINIILATKNSFLVWTSIKNVLKTNRKCVTSFYPDILSRICKSE